MFYVEDKFFLTNLYLYGNELTGEIPPEIINIDWIYGFYIYSNNLSGQLPDEICSLPSTNISPGIHNNNFCPPYPYCISQDDIDSQDTSNCP